MEPRAKKLQIPVGKDAVAVKAAIRRRGNGLSGEYIPFDLYKEMMDFRVQMSRKVTLEIASHLTGDVLSDGMTIKRFLKSGGEGLSDWQEFLLHLEPFLIWFILNQLLGQFSCVEHVECTAAKEPPGTEQPPTQLRLAIAMAAMMMILGMQEDYVMVAVRAPADGLGVPPIDIVNRARRLIQTDLHREVNEMVGANDHSLIIDYANNYISRNPIGYEDWMAYRDVRNIREDTVTTYYYSHQYSQEYSMLLDYSFQGIHQTPLAGGAGWGAIFGAFGGPRGRGVRVESPPDVTTMDPEVFNGMLLQLGAVDASLGMIAGVLTNGFALDLLCCFGRFLGKEDVKRIKRIRSVLQLAYRSLTEGLVSSLAGPVNTLDFVVSAIQQGLLEFIQRYFDQVGRDVIGWISGVDGKTWDDLFYCPLIEDLVAMSLRVVGELRARVLEIVNKYISRIDGLHGAIYQRWGTVYDARRVATIIAILDRLIAAAEACAQYGDGQTPPTPPPNPGEDPSIYAGIPQPLVLDPAVVTKFFGNPNPIKRGEGERPIPPVGTIHSSTEEQVTVRNFRDLCRGVVPDELIASIIGTRDNA